LGHHQRQQPRARPYVQPPKDPAGVERLQLAGHPSPQQTGIGTDFHRAAILVEGELFKAEIAIFGHSGIVGSRTREFNTKFDKK
jgi:hypothetical protein